MLFFQKTASAVEALGGAVGTRERALEITRRISVAPSPAPRPRSAAAGAARPAARTIR